MSSSPDNGTLTALLESHPDWVRTLAINTYDEFLHQVYEELDYAISALTDNPEHAFKDNEDRTTIDLIRSLKSGFRKQSSFHISHEEKIGGHADIVIKHGRYLWIAEAKIFKNAYAWLYKGLLQLVTRYSKGDEYNQEGAILIYIKNENSLRIIERWQGKLEEWSKAGRTRSPLSFSCCGRMKQSFYSSQEHPRSGEDFKVRHIPISLYFNPKDND